jgi:hypothetical protein
MVDFVLKDHSKESFCFYPQRFLVSVNALNENSG